MITLEAAQSRILESIAPLEAETVAVDESLGRICAAPVVAPIPLPVFDNSMMDGYAVRSFDLREASETNPVRLLRVGELPAGGAPNQALESGQCIRIFTGSPMPPGADAVVMQEDAARCQKDPSQVQFCEAVKPWDFVRIRGEDVASGLEIISRGERVHAGAVALMAAVGIGEISVSRKPLVGLMATGSELKEPGQALRPGEIYESNRSLLSSLLKSLPSRARVFPVTSDHLDAHIRQLKQAFEECDTVITTGGVSVGEHDYVKEAFQKIGGEILTWRIAVKPGKPFVFGRLDGKLFFGLPGNPVSAMVSFLFLARPALLGMQGASRTDMKHRKARLAERVVNDGNRRHFMRVACSDSGLVTLAGLQASHGISSLQRSNGLIDAPPGGILEAGTEVEVYLWNDYLAD